MNRSLTFMELGQDHVKHHGFCKESDGHYKLEFEVADRIPTCDNGGNCGPGKPMYFQLYFAIDLVKPLAPDHTTEHGGTVIDMKDDWLVIYPFQLADE